MSPPRKASDRVVGDPGLALALLVGDEVVDGGQRDVVAAVEQTAHQRARIRRVVELHGDTVTSKKPSLRGPQRQVPAAVEGDLGARSGCGAGAGAGACAATPAAETRHADNQSEDSTGAHGGPWRAAAGPLIQQWPMHAKR